MKPSLVNCIRNIDINHYPSKCNVWVVYISSGCCTLICVSIWFWYTPRLLTHILWVSLYETLNKVASYSVPLSDLFRTQLYFICVKEKTCWIIANMLWILLRLDPSLPDPQPPPRPPDLQPPLRLQVPFLDPNPLLNPPNSPPRPHMTCMSHLFICLSKSGLGGAWVVYLMNRGGKGLTGGQEGNTLQHCCGKFFFP